MDFEIANVEFTKEELIDFLLDIDESEIEEAIENIHPVDVLNALKETDEQTSQIILNKLPNEFIAMIIDEDDDENRYDFLIKFSENRQKDILSEMSSDEIADFIGQLDTEEKEEVLAKLSIEDKIEVHDLLQYDPETAGGIMLLNLSVLEKIKQFIEHLNIFKYMLMMLKWHITYM